VSPGFRPGKRVVAARAVRAVAARAVRAVAAAIAVRPPGRRRAEQTRHHGVREEARHFAAQVTTIRLEWMPKVVTAAAK
jgi:hypothetical protein